MSIDKTNNVVSTYTTLNDINHSSIYSFGSLMQIKRFRYISTFLIATTPLHTSTPPENSAYM